MPVFQVDIQKSCDNIYWTNRYYVTAASITDALAPAHQIVEAERASSYNYVSFISNRVSVPGPEQPSTYIVTPEQGQGARVPTAVMHLTVCALVKLNWRAGRPDQKFYRGMIGASDLAQTQRLTAAAVNTIEQGVCAELFDIAALCTKTGQSYTSIDCSQRVSQHQLTRGTRKRTQPIIPVS